MPQPEDWEYIGDSVVTREQVRVFLNEINRFGDMLVFGLAVQGALSDGQNPEYAVKAGSYAVKMFRELID